MTWKTAVADVPLGRWKRGRHLQSPREMSTGELERLSRGYMRVLARYVGLTQDVPAPDVHTNPADHGLDAGRIRSAARAPRTWGDHRQAAAVGRIGRTQPGHSTWRPVYHSRSGETAGAWTWKALPVPFKDMVMSVLSPTVWARNISDSKSWPSATNLAASTTRMASIPRLSPNICGARGRVEGCPETEAIGNTDLLELDVDILIPAAIENQLTGKNAA